MMQEMMAAQAAAAAKKDKVKRKEAKKITKNFGKGLKGGFFNKPKKKKKKKKANAKAKPKAKAASTGDDGVVSIEGGSEASRREAQERLVMPEVQSQMAGERAAAQAAAQKLAQDGGKGWATQHLFQRMAKNPALAMGLQDPECQEVMAMLQKDPAAAMQRCKGSPKLQRFFTEFCGLMGDHFGKLGEKQDEEEAKKKKKAGGGAAAGAAAAPPAAPAPKKKKGPLIQEVKSAAEIAAEKKKAAADAKLQKEADRILEDKSLHEILTDPETRGVLQRCGNPGEMNRFMRDPKWGPRLRKLIDAGVVNVQR